MSSSIKVARRQDHACNMLNNLSTMLQEQMLLDCTLVCDGQVIRGHKVILSSASDYFKRAFASFSSTCQSTAIIIKDMPFHHLKVIVDYIYTGDLTYDSTNLVSLLQSADSLKVDCLVEHLLTLTEAVSSLKSQQYQQRSSFSPNNHQIHQHHQLSPVNHSRHQELNIHHHRHHHQQQQHSNVMSQEKVSRKSISPAASTSPVSLVSTSGSLKNLQMILPLNQCASSSSPSDNIHSSTLAQALTNCNVSPVRKSESNVSGQMMNNVPIITDDDSNDSITSNSDRVRLSCVPKSDQQQQNSHEESTNQQQDINNEIWRNSECDEVEGERPSPVDLSSGNNKHFYSTSELNNNSISTGSNSSSNSNNSKIHYPPKARHFYANGNLLKNNQSGSNINVSNESTSPSSSQSPSNISYEQGQSTVLHHRIFSSSSNQPKVHSLSTSDNILPVKGATIIDESVETMASVAVAAAGRRDSLSSGDNVTLKRGRGRPPRYSIDDENWHSRLRNVMHCNQLEYNDSSSPVKVDLSTLNSAANVNGITNVTNNNQGVMMYNTSDNKCASGTNEAATTTTTTSAPAAATTTPVAGAASAAAAAAAASKRIKLSFDSSTGSLRGRKPKLDYSASSREVSGKNKCPHCPQVYYSTQAMSDHINNVHSKNRFKYVCQTCYKEFSWNISLKKHVRKAHGEESMITSLSQKLLWQEKQHSQ